MNILSVQGQGIIYTVIIFLVCVIAVHGVLLAKIGYRSMRKKTSCEKPKEEAPQKTKQPKPADPEPVYFIVEKKKKRAKSEYTAPREIKFK